eukprot:gene113-7325_t
MPPPAAGAAAGAQPAEKPAPVNAAKEKQAQAEKERRRQAPEALRQDHYTFPFAAYRDDDRYIRLHNIGFCVGRQEAAGAAGGRAGIWRVVGPPVRRLPAAEVAAATAAAAAAKAAAAEAAAAPPVFHAGDRVLRRSGGVGRVLGA